MKKSYFILFAILAFSFTACKWRIPEKISVKTNAEYNFSIGKVEKDLSEYFSLKDVLDSYFDSDSGIVIYDYYPRKTSDKLQQYMFKMPIQNIPIDFSQFFNETNIAKTLGNMSFSKEVTIPDLALNYEKEVGTSMLAQGVNSLVVVTGTTLGGNINFEGNFTSIKYKSGNFIITSSGENISGTATLFYNGNAVSSGTFSDGKASLSLAGKTIYKTGMKLTFTDNTSKAFVGNVENNSSIDTATGVTTTAPLIIPVEGTINQNITEDSTTFISCTVGQGTLNTTINIPNSWSNYTLSYDLKFTGAMNFESEESSGKSKTIDMSDLDIGQGDTTVKTNVKISFDNSTIKFSDAPSLTCKSEIKTLKSATVDLKTSQTSLSETQSLSKEMKEMIYSIDFEPSGITGTYSNTFPEGNNFTLVANSSFFGMSDVSQELASNTQSGELTLLGTSKTELFTDSTSIDFDTKIKLPGYDENHPSYVTVSNVAPNSKYSISLNLEPSINWASITVKTDGMSKDGYISTGLNFNNVFGNGDSTISSVFQGKLSFESVPVYLYCQKPDLDCFNSAKYHGDIEAFYGVGEGNATPTRKNEYDAYAVKFLDSGDMGFANIPTLEKYTTETEEYVITDVSKESYSEKGDLGVLMNKTLDEETGCIYIRYDLSFSNGAGGSNFTITKAEFEASHSKATSIAIYAIVVFPFKFNLSDNVDIDILKLIGQSSSQDLLRRSEATNLNKIESYLEVIEKVSVCYDLTKVPFEAAQPITFEIDLDPVNKTLEPYSLPLQKGSILIQPIEMLSIYPLTPTVYMHLPKSTISLTRDLAFVTGITLKINTNGTIDIWEK